MKHFSDANVAILGTARNVSKYIRKICKVLSDSTIHFKSRTFFIVESYSNDTTIDTLQELAELDKHFFFTSLDTSAINMPPLSVRIAEARNQATNMARQHSIEFDYFVVADLDNVNRGLTPQALESCWNYDGWDMMSANQPFAYYDTWAFRHPILSPGDCWRDYEYLSTFIDKKFAFKYSIENRVIQIPKNSLPLPVTSAFGGLAIYRAEPYFLFEYSGYTDKGIEVCEHVVLNEKLSQSGYKLFINPAMINVKPLRQKVALLYSTLRKRHRNT
jgi:hypothetical protein